MNRLAEGVEKAAIGSVLTAGAAVGAYKGGEVWYKSNLSDRLPEGGTKQSILPFLEFTFNACEEEGIEAEAAGGPPKQVLLDPQSKILPKARTVEMSSYPDSLARRKATLYRPGEFTLRDDDKRVRRIKAFGQWIPANPDPDILSTLRIRGERIQEGVNEYASTLPGNFKLGPELSLFSYEHLQGPFRGTHYATVTHLLDPDNYRGGEVMTHSIGARHVFEYEEPWTFAARYKDKWIEFPMSAPAHLLGRTLTRSLVIRERDLQEVQAAVANIRGQGLYEEVLGERYEEFVDFRNDMDTAMADATASYIMERDGVVSGIHFALARRLAQKATAIENSYLGAMIRDPGSPIYPFTSKIMGALSSGKVGVELPIEEAA